MADWGDVLGGASDSDDDFSAPAKSPMIMKNDSPLAAGRTHSLAPAKFASGVLADPPSAASMLGGGGLSALDSKSSSGKMPPTGGVPVVEGLKLPASPSASEASSSEGGFNSGRPGTARSTLTYRKGGLFGSTKVLVAPDDALRDACIESHFGGVVGAADQYKILGKGVMWLTPERLCVSSKDGRFEWELGELTLCNATERFVHGPMSMSGLGTLLEVEGPCVQTDATNSLAKTAKPLHVAVRGLEKLGEWVADINMRLKMKQHAKGPK